MPAISNGDSDLNFNWLQSPDKVMQPILKQNIYLTISSMKKINLKDAFLPDLFSNPVYIPVTHISLATHP